MQLFKHLKLSYNLKEESCKKSSSFHFNVSCFLANFNQKPFVFKKHFLSLNKYFFYGQY